MDFPSGGKTNLANALASLGSQLAKNNKERLKQYKIS
jgi:hypothetical protein